MIVVNLNQKTGKLKKKLIYICGMGHSGSTILDLALCATPGFISTAQLGDLYVHYDPLAETSSIPAERHHFWKELILELTADDRTKLQEWSRSIIKERALIPTFFSKSRRRAYAEINGRLLHRIFEKAEGNIIIDSSKNVSRCIALTECENIDVYVIHLVRDVRGLINSTNKRNNELSRPKRFIRPTLHWFLKNAASSILLPFRANRLLKIHYEELVFSPRETVKRLELFIEEDLSEFLARIDGREVIDPGKSIGFGGNRVLQGKDKLAFRTRVVEKGRVFDSNLYWYTLGWLSTFWGYRRKVDYFKEKPQRQ